MCLLIRAAPILFEPVLSWAVIVDALTATSQAGDISANGIISDFSQFWHVAWVSRIILAASFMCEMMLHCYSQVRLFLHGLPVTPSLLHILYECI